MSVTDDYPCATQSGMGHDTEATETAQPEQARVLLIEDEAIVSRWLQLLLSHAGQESRVAGNAEEAEAFLRTHPDWADVIYVDLTLPDRFGLDLIQKWKSSSERLDQTTWIAASGFAENETIDALERLGALYLPKPFSGDDFLRNVRQAHRD